MRPRYFCVAPAIWLTTAAGLQWVFGGDLGITGPLVVAAAWQSSDSEARDLAIMERFLGVLEQNPRRGTALDRVYGYHVERGTLDELIARYRERTVQDATDGAAWMILGMIEAQRGRDAAAVAAFQDAEKTLTDSALPAYYLGQSLVLVGQPDAAAEAFERAITRKPGRSDLLEIFQALGRVYQRAHRNEQAIAVWGRLEKLFPDDLRVQEQIAATLAEEDQHAEALRRYERLTELVPDDEYRLVTFRIQAAELKVRLGSLADALADFERILGRLNPDSWLFREVRRRIEEVFLRNDDLAGLASYYEGWIEKNSDDIEAMTRLARTLANLGRAAEAQEWYDKAIKLAPSRKELRLALIEQFVRQQKFAESIAQYEALDKNEPNNPDYVREWGRLILKDTGRPEEERKRAAAATWRRLIDAKPNDAVMHAQVADLFRQAEMTEEAITLYQKAIDLAPEATQYREYLGEYYHTLKRPDEALATWREIATGGRRNDQNLTRLAEVMSGFGYLNEAAEAMAEACQLDTDDFERQFKYAELLYKSERYDEAAKHLGTVATLAEKEEEQSAVLELEVKNLQASEQLAAQRESLERRLNEDTNAPAAEWRRLARFLEAERKIAEATTAIQRAIELEESSIVAWAVLARLHESAGNLVAAAEANRRLAAIDRRARTEYLTNVAKLESRLGRKDPALQAGRELIAAAPGNPEGYQVFAELCFQLGETEEGFDSLRRAARVNPSDPQALLTLAAALSERFRTDEAIELYWQSFDKAPDLDARLGIVSSLAAAYLQLNQFDRLVERLSRLRSEAKEPREMTICLAQAYQAAQDFGTARQELERLLSINIRDTKLLGQLSQLAETERDYAAAAKYQRQLNDVAPSKDGDARLATLYVRSGETSEAEAIWTQLAAGDQEPHRVLEAIDQLLTNSKHETALVITERLLRARRNDWEVLYREGVALAALDKFDDAARQFQSLLEIRLDDDEKSAIVKARLKGAGRPPGSPATSRQPLQPQTSPAMDRINAVWQIRQATGLETRHYYGGSPATWSPPDFGQARMAALGWLFRLGEKESEHEEFVTKLKEAAAKPAADTRPQWDLYYLQLIRQEQKAAYEAARSLSKASEPAARWAYLMSLAGRAAQPGVQVIYRGSDSSSTVDKTPPLDGDEIDHMLTCFRSLEHAQQDWMYQSVLSNVTTELKRAQRAEEEEKIYRDGLDSATHVDTISGFLGLAAGRGDTEGVLTLLERLQRQQGAKSRYGYYYNPLQQAGYSLGQLMHKRAEAKAHTDIVRVFDHYFAAVRDHQKNAPPSRSSSYGNPYGTGMPYYQIWTGGPYARGIQIDFPLPNEYFDFGSIQLLRNAYELYKRDDLLSDLFAHFRKQAGDAPELDRVFPQLALGYMHWWSDEKDLAVAELARAAEYRKDDLNLQLELAEIRERHGQPDDALAIVESIQPIDNNIMKRREIIAMRVAVATGNVERARQSAERLFGLQLDADLQRQLAAQMYQLGMHELSEAVLARARRRGGNRTDSLVSLMQQYQAQNKPDVSVQIAHQILRTTSSQSRGPGYRTQEDVAREAAIQTLARSGKLQDMIGRTEGQLKASPHSLQLHEMLADYYRAAGQRDKVKEVYERMVELRPDDARLRYQIASQLVQAGEPAQAIEHYRVAFKKEPALFGRNYYEVQSTFQRANKLDELVKFMDEVDLKSLGSYGYVSNLVQTLVQDEKTRDQGLKLFRKAWQVFPNERSYLMSSMYNEEIWKLPEMYDYAREAVIPSPTQTQIQAWTGLDSIYSWSGDGKVTTVVTRLLDAATKQNKLDAIAKEVKEALDRVPDWSGGKALLAILQARQGQTEPAKQALQAMLEDTKNRMPNAACWVIGQELENYGAVSDVALKIFEAGMRSEESDHMEFSYHPAKRLIGLYQRAGRAAEGRELVLKFAKRPSQYEYDPQYAAYRKLNELNSMADTMLQLGYPADAVRFYSEVLADTERREMSRRFYGDRDYISEQAQQGLNRAIQALTGETLARTMQELLKPRENRDGSEPAIDLVLLVLPREIDRTAVTSMLASAIQMSGEKSDLRASMEESLNKLLADNPQDFTVHIAATLHAFGANSGDAGKSATVAQAVASLVQLIDSHPLEDLPPGTVANARQRAEAAQQLGLWLVARECWKAAKASHEPSGSANDLSTDADRFAERALEAARRQIDTGWTLAMLRELGQIALDRGDRETAERHWAQMLEVIIPKPVAKPPPTHVKPAAGARTNHPPLTPVRADLDHPTLARASSSSFLSVLSVLLTPRISAATTGAAESSGVQQDVAIPRNAGQPAAPASGSGAPVPPLTLDRFDQVARLAKLAAENKMHALSLRAISEATRGGPPISARPDGSRFGAPTSRSMIMSPGMSTEDQSISRQVEARIFELDPIWNRHGAPAEEVYEALAKLVLPDARGGEIFLYAIPLADSRSITPTPGGSRPQPRSVAAVLVRWAVAAGKADNLRRRVEARQDGPLAQVPARILHAQLAHASRDTESSKAALAWLADRLQKDTLQNSADLACHVALPALDVPDTVDLAMPIVEQSVKNMAGQANVAEEPASSLIITLARLEFDRKNTEEGKKHLEEFLRIIDRSVARYGGDYGPYRRKLGVQRMATEFTRAGLLEPALDMLGQYADAPAYRYGETGPGLVVGLVVRLLGQRPGAERFELLRNWTMPTDSRKSVRLLGSFVPVDDSPPVLRNALVAHYRPAESTSRNGAGTEAAEQGSGGPGENGRGTTGKPTRNRPNEKRGGTSLVDSTVVSTANVLIESAKEAERLEELAEALKKLADEKIENARTLHVLAEVALGRSEGIEPLVKELAVELSKKLPAQDTNRYEARRIDWADYLLARTCLFDPKLGSTGEKMVRELITHGQRVQDHLFIPRLRADLASAVALRERITSGIVGRPAGLALWGTAAHQSAATRQSGSPPATWVTHEGHVRHMVGPERDYLYFNYPLTGSFEFAVDGYIGGWAESGLSYGGLLFECTIPSNVQLSPIGMPSYNWRPFRFLRTEAFNRLTVQVRPDKVRYLINDHLFHEDASPSPANPWLALYGSRERQTTYRDFRLTGAPQIPREVRLTHADRLEGWISTFYAESQPPARQFVQPAKGPIAPGGTAQLVAATLPEFDWSIKEGVIAGRRSDLIARIDPLQSRLYYHRPIRSGERLSYEFYYEPDNVMVHPALDRLAFLLDPNGVRLHWMTDAGDIDWSGLKSDNAADEPSNRRGPDQIPLKPGEWNSLELSLVGNTTFLKLNDVEIYERELEPTNDRLFGFFHYRDRTSVRVRNVVLRGEWPDRLGAEQLADLVAHSGPMPSAAELRASGALVSEAVIAQSAETVLRQARRLPPNERYSLLTRWILPNDEHAAVRLYAEFSSTDPAPIAGAERPNGMAPAAQGRLLHHGGSIESPAQELVAVANELNNLDQLADRIQRLQVTSEHDQRATLALMTIIRITRGDDDRALEALRQLHALVEKMPLETPVEQRWPEMIAAHEAIRRPTLQATALAILDHVVVKQLEPILVNGVNVVGKDEWGRRVRHLRARAQVVAQAGATSAVFGGPLTLDGWSPVVHAKAVSRGVGAPLPHWSAKEGELRHYPGHDNDHVYLNVPLRGDFEVNCELTSFGWRDAQLCYAGLQIGPKYDLKTVELFQHGRHLRNISIDPPLENLGDWFAFRLAVQDRTLTASIKGREVFKETLPAGHDPWLAAHFFHWSSGGVRNLKISGNPSVPESLELSALSDLTGWMTYYDEPLTGDNRAWEKRGEELFGRAFTDLPGSKQESILQYHRPILEDGAIDYEFFYEPSKAATHPALDRLVFLLEPDGVKTHWLTDAGYERTGLTPDNVTVEETRRRGPAELPLKAADWNRLQLAVKGDTVSLRLNDELIYERPVESTNRRIFGLFHYADETEVRVRNVTYRGQWPRALPPDQELEGAQ